MTICHDCGKKLYEVEYRLEIGEKYVDWKTDPVKVVPLCEECYTKRLSFMFSAAVDETGVL